VHRLPIPTPMSLIPIQHLHGLQGEFLPCCLSCECVWCAAVSAALQRAFCAFPVLLAVTAARRYQAEYVSRSPLLLSVYNNGVIFAHAEVGGR
jgi:hypothetical protein